MARMKILNNVERVQIVDRDLTKKQKEKLEQLLVKELETDKRYPLTLLKKPLNSMRPQKIRGKLDELKGLLALYLDGSGIAKLSPGAMGSTRPQGL